MGIDVLLLAWAVFGAGVLIAWAGRDAIVEAARGLASVRAGRARPIWSPGPRPPEVLPPDIAADGRLVFLTHDGAAHVDRSRYHWSLRLGPTTAGVAHRRRGVITLLRAVRGADVVYFERHAVGLRAHRLSDLVAVFESGALPVERSCPDARSERPEGTEKPA